MAAGTGTCCCNTLCQVGLTTTNKPDSISFGTAGYGTYDWWVTRYKHMLTWLTVIFTPQVGICLSNIYALIVDSIDEENNQMHLKRFDESDGLTIMATITKHTNGLAYPTYLQVLKDGALILEGSAVSVGSNVFNMQLGCSKPCSESVYLEMTMTRIIYARPLGSATISTINSNIPTLPLNLASIGKSPVPGQNPSIPCPTPQACNSSASGGGVGNPTFVNAQLVCDGLYSFRSGAALRQEGSPLLSCANPLFSELSLIGGHNGGGNYGATHASCKRSVYNDCDKCASSFVYSCVYGTQWRLTGEDMLDTWFYEGGTFSVSTEAPGYSATVSL